MSSFYCFGFPEYGPNCHVIESDEEFVEFIASAIESINDGSFCEVKPEPCIVQCSKCALRVQERQQQTKEALERKKEKKLRLKPGYTKWRDFKNDPPIPLEEVIGFSWDWVDENENPTGKRVGFINDDGKFTSAYFNSYHNCYDTGYESVPEKWTHFPKRS